MVRHGVEQRTALAAALAGIALLAATAALPNVRFFDGANVGDTPLYHTYGENMRHGKLPYRDFFEEYPPGALPAFALPAVLPGASFTFWSKALQCLLAACCIVFVALTLRTSRWRAALIGLTPALLGQVTFTRFDFWPAALTAAALAAIVARRHRIALAVLAVAVAAKEYPLVLLPLAGIYVWRRAGARRVLAALAVFVVVAAAVVVPFAAYDVHGVASSFRSQAERGLQIESLGASVLLAADRLGLYDAKVVETTGVAGRNLSGSLPDAVAVLTLVLEAVAVVAVWLLYARARDARARLPVAFAAAVAGFLAFTKVFSPQYLVWLVPLVVLAGSWVAVSLTAVSLVLAQAWFFHYHALFRLAWPTWLLLVRDLLVLGAFLVLAGGLARGQPDRWKIRIPSRSKTSRHSGLRRNQESWTAVGRGANRSA